MVKATASIWLGRVMHGTNFFLSLTVLSCAMHARTREAKVGWSRIRLRIYLHRNTVTQAAKHHRRSQIIESHSGRRERQRQIKELLPILPQRLHSLTVKCHAICAKLSPPYNGCFFFMISMSISAVGRALGWPGQQFACRFPCLARPG